MTEDYNNERKSRVDRMEQALQILKALALRADERMDDFDSSLNNLTVKIEALTDAQIRHEEKSAAEMGALREAQRSLAAKVEALVDAQIRSVERLVQSEERVTWKFEAMAEAHQSLTVKVEALAEGQAETDRRLRELIEIVREGRGGGAA